MIRPISIPPPVPSAPVFDPAGRANAQRDWDSLFHAVMTRLSNIAAEPSDDNAAGARGRPRDAGLIRRTGPKGEQR